MHPPRDRLRPAYVAALAHRLLTAAPPPQPSRAAPVRAPVCLPPVSLRFVQRVLVLRWIATPSLSHLALVVPRHNALALALRNVLSSFGDSLLPSFLPRPSTRSLLFARTTSQRPRPVAPARQPCATRALGERAMVAGRLPRRGRRQGDARSVKGRVQRVNGEGGVHRPPKHM